MQATRYGDVRIGQDYYLEDGEGPYTRLLTNEDLSSFEDLSEILDELVWVKD